MCWPNYVRYFVTFVRQIDPWWVRITATRRGAADVCNTTQTIVQVCAR